MIIRTDKEGKVAIEQLCEIAVRYIGGQLIQTGMKHMPENTQSLVGIAKISNATEQLPLEQPKAKDDGVMIGPGGKVLEESTEHEDTTDNE